VADHDFTSLEVRPILPGERERFDAELDEYHWLGHCLVGETMRYVALDRCGCWAALVGFGACALSCKPRDVFLGWSDAEQFRRLRYVTNNQRFCVLPAARRHNLASVVLSRTLRRLCGDYLARWGHPVLVVETFVDPALHVDNLIPRRRVSSCSGRPSAMGARRAATSTTAARSWSLRACFAETPARSFLRASTTLRSVEEPSG